MLGRSKRGGRRAAPLLFVFRSEEHTSELQSQSNLVCRLLLEKKKKQCYIPCHFMKPRQTAALLRRMPHTIAPPGCPISVTNTALFFAVALGIALYGYTLSTRH